MKVCSKCKADKPISEFYKNKSYTNGFDSTCKLCRNKDGAKYYTSLKGRYAHYKAGAKTRGHDFNLTFDEFKSYWNQPCYYCGNPIVGIGLDRINSNMGYHVNNVVSCCAQCNTAKMAVTQSEFFAMIKRIYELHNLEGE